MNIKIIFVLLSLIASVFSAAIGLASDENIVRTGKGKSGVRTPPRRVTAIRSDYNEDKHPDYDQFL
jgi:hypothetical protein